MAVSFYLKFFLKDIILYMDCFACIYVCVPCVCLMPLEVRRGRKTPQNYSFSNWSWESNLDPLQEQQML